MVRVVNEALRTADQATATEPSPAPTEHETGDDVLVTLFQAGESDMFRLLVERHRERVRGLIYSILNDPSVVDDLAQDVFIRVFEALPRFRFDAAFTTWLYRITVNRCRDEIRRKKLRSWLSLHHLLERNDRELARHTTVAPEDPETREIIGRAIEALPEKFRIPILLRDVDGLSYEEIAEVLECEIGTVKSRLFRGRALLRTALQPLMDR
jgi:RNA polymerase sigma-70 factor, ECF subfamily